MLFNKQKNRVAMLLWLAIISSVAQSQGCAAVDDDNGFGVGGTTYNSYIDIAPGSIAPSVIGIDWKMLNFSNDRCFKYLNFRFSDGTNQSMTSAANGAGSLKSVSVTGTINAMESCAGADGYIKGINFYVHGSINPL